MISKRNKIFAFIGAVLILSTVLVYKFIYRPLETANQFSSKVFLNEISIADQIRACMPMSDIESRDTCQRLLAGITKYYECVQAGFPIMKSNPPKCATPDGRIFVEDASRVSTLTGLHVCLPVKDPTVPHNDVCRFGILTDGGEYYAIDLSVLQTAGIIYPTGTRLNISGLLTPIEAISSDFWQEFNIKGIMKVTDAEEV